MTPIPFPTPATPTPAPTLADDLIQEYCQAKMEADVADQRKKDLAAQIIAALGAPDEGQQSHTIGGYKVTVKRTVSRTMDWAIWDTVKETIHPDLHPIETKTVTTLDEKGVKWLQNNEPDIYQRLSPALTVKPGNPTLTVAIRDKDKA